MHPVIIPLAILIKYTRNTIFYYMIQRIITFYSSIFIRKPFEHVNY